MEDAQNFTGMSDAELEEQFQGDSEEPEQGVAEGEQGALEQEGSETEQDQTEITPEDLHKQVQELREQVSQRDQQLNQQRSTIDRQGNELGELRKMRAQIEERLQKVQQGSEEEEYDPRKLRESWREEQQLNSQLQQVDSREKQIQAQQKLQQNVEYLQKALPEEEFKGNVDEIAAMLDEAKVEPTVVQQFRSNPFAFAAQYQSPSELVVINQMANLRKKNKELEQKLAEAQGQTKSTLDKIEKTARTTLANKTGATKQGGKEIDTSQIAQLSDDELDRIINGG